MSNNIKKRALSITAKTLCVLALALPLPALTFRSATDLDAALKQGCVDDDRYLALKELAGDRVLPCGPLGALLEVPGVTERDLDTIESLCGSGLRAAQALPPELFDKIALFLEDREETARRGISAGGRMTAPLPGPRAPGGAAGEFSLGFDSRGLSAASRGDRTAAGQGRFLENRLVLRGKGGLRKLEAGSFRGRVGSGVTFGGMPSVRSSPAQSNSFEQSLLSPANSLPFGVHGELSRGRIRPFAFAFKGRGMAPFARVSGGGASLSVKGLAAGLAGFSGFLPMDHGSRLPIRALGAFAALKKGDSRLSGEAAVTDSGAAIYIKGLRSLGGSEAGATAALYSARYFNPCSRGPSSFSLYSFKVRSFSDSVTLSGMRRNEQRLCLFAKTGRGGLALRPTLTAARSGLFDEEKAGLSLTEEAAFRYARLELNQYGGLVRNGSGTRRNASLSACGNIVRQDDAGLFAQARCSFSGKEEKTLSAGLRISLPLTRLLTADAGWRGTRSFAGAAVSDDKALVLGEGLELMPCGRLAASVVLPYERGWRSIREGDVRVDFSLLI